jgi:hypothetical protein
MKCLKWIFCLSLCFCTSFLSAQSMPSLFANPFEGMELKKEWTEHPAFKEYKAALEKLNQIFTSGTLDFAALEEETRKLVKDNPHGPKDEQQMLEAIKKIKGGKEFVEANVLASEKAKILNEKLPDFVAYQKEFFQKKAKGNH